MHKLKQIKNINKKDIDLWCRYAIEFGLNELQIYEKWKKYPKKTLDLVLSTYRGMKKI